MTQQEQIGKRIKEIRIREGYSQEDLALLLGYKHKSSVHHIESGRDAISSKLLLSIAKALHVTVDELLGIDPKNKTESVKIPVYASVGAGFPAFADDEIIDQEEIPRAMAQSGEYFALKVRGESMLPKISSGDTVIVRKQDTADDGDMVIALIDHEEGLVKRLKRHENGLSLISTNPAFEPIFYTWAEVEALPVTILGVVVELRAKI